MKTFAPAFTKALAVENPMPVVPPMRTMTLLESANIPPQLSGHFGFCFRGQSGAQVTLTRRAGDGHDHLSFVLGPFADFQSSNDVRPCGDADKQAFFLAKTPSHGKGIIVGDLDALGDL